MKLSICCSSVLCFVAVACSSSTDSSGPQGGSGGDREPAGAGGEAGQTETEQPGSGGSGGTGQGAPGGGAGMSSVAGTGGSNMATGGTPAQGGAAGGNPGTGGAAISPSTCPQPACQDFETELVPAVWSLSANAATTKVVTDAVTALRAPGKALQIHLPKTSAEALARGYVSLKTIPDAVKNGHGDLFARFYTYFSAPHDFRHSFIMRANGAANESNVEFGGQMGNKWILAPLGKISAPTGDIPVKKWICVEAQFKKAAGELKLLVDGQQVASATANTADPLTTYRFIQLGLYPYHDVTVDFDMYVDDVAYDVKPIGCLSK